MVADVSMLVRVNACLMNIGTAGGLEQADNYTQSNIQTERCIAS